MNRNLSLTAVILLVFTSSLLGQAPLKEYKVGHIFSVSLPDYMSKTTGINSASAIQYKNSVKDVYGFIIEDTKEELDMADLHYSSIGEFYDGFIKDFLKDQEKRNISELRLTRKGEINIGECDASYYDTEAKLEIYYLVGVVETKHSYYKVISWSSLENKDKYKADFQKILYSVKD